MCELKLRELWQLQVCLSSDEHQLTLLTFNDEITFMIQPENSIAIKTIGLFVSCFLTFSYSTAQVTSDFASSADGWSALILGSPASVTYNNAASGLGNPPVGKAVLESVEFIGSIMVTVVLAGAVA